MACSKQAAPAIPAGRETPTARTAPNGLFFGVAENTDQVVQAWELVYRSYVRTGLIDPNQSRIHTVPQAVGPNTAVVRGCLSELVICTLSSYLDGPDGLPLDAVYHDQLQAMREQGKVPLELGLFADRREHLYRSIDALLELMRFGIGLEVLRLEVICRLKSKNWLQEKSSSLSCGMLRGLCL